MKTFFKRQLRDVYKKTIPTMEHRMEPDLAARIKQQQEKFSYKSYFRDPDIVKAYKKAKDPWK